MIREARVVTVPRAGDDVRRAVTFALTQHGFDFARHEPGYLEARRGKVTPMRVVSLMKVEDTPVVVCVSIDAIEADLTRVSVGAYPDLGPGVFMGPIARRKWRPAMVDAVTVVGDAAVGTAEVPMPAI